MGSVPKPPAPAPEPPWPMPPPAPQPPPPPIGVVGCPRKVDEAAASLVRFPEASIAVQLKQTERRFLREIVRRRRMPLKSQACESN